MHLDDVVFYSGSWQLHVSRLGALLDRLVAACLKVNLAKCEFARAPVTYLGKVVGRDRCILLKRR